MNVIVIAEAGVNHNGVINLAKQLIEVASKSGADYVKFQTFKTELVISKDAKKADYQKENTDNKESQFEMAKKLELDKDTHIELIKHCKTKGIKFLSTPFDLESIDLLFDLGVKMYKIPSGEITNYPYLIKIAQKQLPVIMSTGMANLSEIEQALDILLDSGLKRNAITILHCNTEYPTPICDVNLKAMLTIKDAFKVNIGYSDHTLGIEVPIAAVALGATVIEKHFTLDRNMEGPDHKASLEPQELKEMVKAVRNIELAMGSGIKKPSVAEIKNITAARKSIHARKDIKKGDLFSEDNLIALRPGNGISPMRWSELIGEKSFRVYKCGDKIQINRTEK